ncbi:MAG: hypothetical protein Q7U20_08475 [Caulobacter sp.]|nr:hypothetical protein [Caulobacter sp.]
MAPYLLVLALLLQDAPAAPPPSDGPMATAVPRKQEAAPLPIQGGVVTAPTDDYGYVGWCAGAIASYVELYDRAMPEVIRIERAWPTPSTEENITKVYPEQREEAKRNLALFARAMKAAEQASPTPIQAQGQAAVRRGRAVWTGAGSVPKAQLAQFWMSWSPPARCEETARALETRSRLLGQALTYNTPGATIAAPPLPSAEAPPLLVARPPAAPVATPATSTPEAAPDIIEPPAEASPTPTGAPPTVAPEPEASAASPDGVLSMTPLPQDDGDATTEVAGAAPSAIDDLLPAGEPAPTPEPAAAPVAEAPPPAVASAASQPAAPRKYKKGLKETLQGLRGSQ